MSGKQKSNPVPAATKVAPASALDLASLEVRLTQTKAIGVFTKLTLKNQVDDLLDQFRGFYRGDLKTTLAHLRLRYDLLLMKILTVIQDGDRALAKAIGASREAVWAILSSRERFANIK